MNESQRQATATGPGDAPAWRSGGAWAVMLAVLALGLATDLGSKWAAFRYMSDRPVVVERENVLSSDDLSWLLPQPPPRVTIVPKALDLTLVLNRGAVFGMGAGRRWFFIAFTAGAIVFALWMFGAWTTTRSRMAHVAIGLLLAGGLGNLYDRLVYACVRDFLHPLPGVKWPGGADVWPYVSNIADLWLLVGIGILMGYLWKGGKREAPAQPVASDAR